MERFSLARERVEPVDAEIGEIGGRGPLGLVGPSSGGVTRWVDRDGRIRIATHAYQVGRTFAGELVEVVVSGGLVEIFHRQALIANVQRGQATLDGPVRERPGVPRARRPASGRIRVSQPLADDLQRDASFQEDRSVRMAEII